MDALIIPALGTSAVVFAFFALVTWDRRCRRHARTLDVLDPRILVTGTRGKSSTVRLLHSALLAAGLAPWARVSGTVTEEVTPDGDELTITRPGQHSVLELMGTVERAEAAGARSLVTECMAVHPELIALTQRTIVRADFAVITNVRADHLEDEGLDAFEIARSLAGVAESARIVITSEHDPEVLAVIREEVGRRGAACVTANGDWLPPEIRAQLPEEHPDNIAVVLAVSAELGIHTDDAIRGMRHSTHEPLALRPISHQVEYEGCTYTLASLGSINDPESTREALDRLETAFSDAPYRIAIVTSRWDRPLRSISFAGFLRRCEFDAVLIAGAAYHPMRWILRRNGFARHEIRSLRWIDTLSAATFLRRLHQMNHNAPTALVASLANVDPPIARRLVHLLEPYLLVDLRQGDAP